MTSAKIASGREHSRSLGDEAVDSMADEDLLVRFLGGDHEVSELAFRTIVVRHGPMVLGVCRHVLGGQQDAEDAFQATFLVLARKAGTIRDSRVLGRWLYEVGFRIAVRARTNDKRRRTHERQVVEMSSPAPDNEVQLRELRPILHEEVNRLPEKYRTPVVLCYLEGKTNEEVARLMNWPVGTVKGRLSRAREILRSRLTRRGLSLSSVLLLTALSDDSVLAEEVPALLIDHTVKSGMRIADGRLAATGDVSIQAMRLMDLDLAASSTFLFSAVARRWLVIAAALFALAASANALSAVVGPPSSWFFQSIPPVDPQPAAPAGCHADRPTTTTAP